MDNSPLKKRRLAFLVVGLSDTIFGGLVLLLYFGYLPFDISWLGLPRWIIGFVGALWFFSGLAVFIYQLTRTVDTE